MKVILNSNDRVRVKLTNRGRQILEKYYGKWIELESFVPYTQDAAGYYKFHLWELMQIFGPSMYMGMEVPFEHNIMEVV